MDSPDPDSDVALSDLQLDVMRVLWRGDASVADVVAALAGQRDLAHTTIATVLTRLARRGVVTACRDGRQLLYRACVTEPQVRRSMVGSLIQSLFRGDAKALLAHLVDERDVAPDELERVQQLLDAHADGAARPGKTP